MKTFIVILTIATLFQGCDLTDPTCGTQQCTNGVMTFMLCNRSGNQNIIFTDESGKALLCNQNK